MDIQRPASVAQGKKRKQIMMGVVGVLVVGLVSVVLARLKPAAPTVERATVWVDTVKRGPMLRQVRGLGTLVPVDEARRWVPASTQGRVERIVLRPGVQVTPDTADLKLSDPQVQPAMNDAEQQLRAAYKGRLIGVAESVARLPSVVHPFGTPQPAQTIQPIAEVIRQASNVTYVVVTDRNGVRQSHPNPAEIGRPVSTDPSVPLSGEIYVGTQTGTLGESWRVKVPIFDGAGTGIGSASVGVLGSTLA